MHIAIIGTGNVGGALAERWAKAGHTIHLGVRDIDHFKGQELLGLPNTTAHLTADAVAQSDVILIAATPEATVSIATQLGDVNGKVIIDSMNSVRTRPEPYSNTFEALKALAPGAQVVKCFNSTGFENMRNPSYDAVAIDMFMAGSAEKGKDTARQLALDAGFAACYDFGGDEKVALLEQFALAWINLAIMQGEGRGIAFKLLRRTNGAG
ncbi:MAG: NAD(P)-binding domain-containing protein [Saprospiraceae bacterium]|nr:NAD(P)-binding domain-containing protein [Saprospiraceae bacterium]